MKEIVVPEIETERFLIRQIKLDDLDEWTRLKYPDSEVMRYLPRRNVAPRDLAPLSN